MVHGRSDETIRAACEDPNVDMLMHLDEGRRPLGIAAARAAEQNQVAIGFDLSPLIRFRGSYRSRWLDVQRRSIELARKFDHLDLRTPRDLMALAEVMGLEHSEAEEAMNLPGKLLDLNLRSWQGPGVELL
jgi:ribonuclease P/MRP protein subunit RPP1